MTHRKRQLDALAIGLLITCCLLWGVNQVAAKLTLPHVPPFLQAGLRSLVAGTLVALLGGVAGHLAVQAVAARCRAGLLAGTLFALEFG